MRSMESRRFCGSTLTASDKWSKRTGNGFARNYREDYLGPPDQCRHQGPVGHRLCLGWFCTVRDGGRLRADYDSMANGYDGLQGLAKTLITHGWFTSDDL